MHCWPLWHRYSGDPERRAERDRSFEEHVLDRLASLHDVAVVVDIVGYRLTNLVQDAELPVDPRGCGFVKH